MDVTKTSDCFVSFIIPSFNEEAYIENTLQAIHNNHPDCPFEVILVDNGSTDKTVQIAQQFKISVLIEPTATIAQLRNRGCEQAIGNILIFLDADVCLTTLWKENIPTTLLSLLKNPFQITGFRCISDHPSTWLNKYWFNNLRNTKASYVNSGHMITSAEMFNTVGGFSENLKTAEDYDFCSKAKLYGASITNNERLPAIHFGYPRSLFDFIQRERWHGSEDFKCFSNFVKSKTAQIAVFNLLLLTSSVIMLFLGQALIILWLLGVLLIALFVMTFIKFGISAPFALFNTALIFEFYLFGRGLACIDSIIGRPKTSGHRR